MYKTHGAYGSKENSIWRGMRNRCSNPNNAQYLRYGGRGIKCCQRWDSFANFIEDMGPIPSPQHTLERIDTNGNYEPNNCKWATRTEQSNNMRTTNLITYNGKTQGLSQWALELGIPRITLQKRYQQHPDKPAYILRTDDLRRK